MEEYICQFCGKQCKNSNSLRNHERLCKMNPNKDEHSLSVMAENRKKWNKTSHPAWNKGLTKETDERVKQYSNKNKGNQVWLGRHHTEESKRKISETQKRNYNGKSRYSTVREHRQSYAEQYFNTIFVNAEKQLPVDRYKLDFAWSDIKVYIEIDGEQHYLDQRIIEHDKERTQRLHDMGWRLLTRIRWSDFQKLKQIERENLVYRLLQTIKIQKLQ